MMRRSVFDIDIPTEGKGDGGEGLSALRLPSGALLGSPSPLLLLLFFFYINNFIFSVVDGERKVSGREERGRRG